MTHNAVWKTDRNPPLTGHFPDRRRPDRSGLDPSHKAVGRFAVFCLRAILAASYAAGSSMAGGTADSR